MQGTYDHFAVERGIIAILPINIKNKEGKYITVVYALGRISDTHESVCILYHIKAKIIYLPSRGYNNMNFYEKLANLWF